MAVVVPSVGLYWLSITCKHVCSFTQVLDKNTVKLVAAEYDLLVVDKEEVSVTDAAKKSREWMELEDLDHAVSVVLLVLGGREGALEGGSVSGLVCAYPS